MSFTKKTAFEARLTNNEYDRLANIAGKFFVSTTETDCDAGQLCVRSSRLPCEGFSGVYNENTWKMVTATDSTDADVPVYACNPYDNQLIAAGDGNTYFIGQRTLGLGIPAGKYGTFTRINFDGQSVYRFGEGNVTLNTSTDTFFTISSTGKLTSAATAPEDDGAIYFKLAGTGKFIEGASESFGYYDLVACKVSIYSTP